MSLIRYLSSGSRGLTKGAPPMGRYRLPDGRLIPNFGTEKNPFSSKTLPAQDEIRLADGVTARAASTQAAPPSLAQSPFRNASGVVKLKLIDILRSLAGSIKTHAAKFIGVIRGMSPAVVGKLMRRSAKAALATSSKPQPAGPVQGELSLERVRVVRNDLSDTDYEVVSAETVTASPVRKVPRTVAVQTTPRPLGRLAERLFGQKVH